MTLGCNPMIIIRNDGSTNPFISSLVQIQDTGSEHTASEGSSSALEPLLQ